MPLRNEPKSLKDSSMICIARNFDYLCYNCRSSTEMSKMLEDESFLLVEGPFQEFPSTLLTDMMALIGSSETKIQLHRKHLHLLLLPQIEVFKLSLSSGIFCVIELIKKRCKRLKRLDLSYLCHLSPPILVRLIPTLEHIVALNFKMTEITDQILSLIGKHCPEIKDLNVTRCPITNDGICSLCYDAEEQKIQCKKLIRLSVTNCMVTMDSLFFLLQKIPTLRELEYDNILQIFNKLGNLKLNKNTLKELTSKVYHINQLTSTDDNVTCDGIEFAVHLCPMVTNVTISNSIINNETLYKIMTLQNLAHIRLTNNDSQSLDFYEGVLPVLTVCGHKLVSLLLANFTMIDVSAIGECCPKLRNFAVSNIGIFEEILYPNENYFTELSVLEIWTSLNDESMNGALLKQVLMFCPNLHNLLVNGSRALTDAIFSEVLSINKMRELNRITIDNCPNISRSTIEALLDTKNKVTLIRIWNCFLISKEDDIFLQRKIKKENCDVYLEWFAWLG